MTTQNPSKPVASTQAPEELFVQEPLTDRLPGTGSYPGIAVGCIGHNRYREHYRALAEKPLEDEGFRAAVSAAYSSMMSGNMLEKAIDRPDSNWLQTSLGADGEPAGLSQQAPIKDPKDGVADGVASVMRLMAISGQGSIYTHCLKESGFWVTLRPVRSPEVMALVESIQRDTVSFGRESFGLLGAAGSVYTTRRVLEFCVNHITKTNIIDFQPTVDSMSKLLTRLGLEELINGVMRSTHCSGLSYTRQCIDPAAKCTTSKTGVIDVDHLRITDQAAFTPEAIDHLFTKRDSGVTLEAVKEWRTLIDLPSELVLDLPEQFVKLKLRQPYLDRVIAEGYAWIAAVTAEAAKSNEPNDSEDAILGRVVRFSEVSKAREYESYVHSMETDGVTTTGRKGVSLQLEFLSSDNGFVEALERGVDELLTSTAINVFGVHEWLCEGCGNPQRLATDQPGIIGLNQVSCFLLVCFRRWEAAQARSEV